MTSKDQKRESLVHLFWQCSKRRYSLFTYSELITIVEFKLSRLRMMLSSAPKYMRMRNIKGHKCQGCPNWAHTALRVHMHERLGMRLSGSRPNGSDVCKDRTRDTHFYPKGTSADCLCMNSSNWCTRFGKSISSWPWAYTPLEENGAVGTQKKISLSEVSVAFDV